MDGAELGLRAWSAQGGAGPAWEDGNPSLRVTAGPGSRSSTFSGAGLLESATEKTRRPEAFAFCDARLGTQPPSAERPTKSDLRRSLRNPSFPTSRGAGVSVLFAAVLVAMECPHLSSSVCIAPDSAKFPNGSPSSWCCSGECGPRRPCCAPEVRAQLGLPSRGRGRRRVDSATSKGEPGPAPWEGYAVRRPRRAEWRRLLCFPRPDGPAGEGEARAGGSPLGPRACGGNPAAWPPHPAVPRGSARRCCRVESSGGGCPAPTGRSYVCVCGGAGRRGGPELRPVLRGTGKTPLCGRSFVWAAGRARALRRLLRLRYLSLTRRLRQPDPRRAGAPSPERCSKLRRWTSESFISQ